MFDPVVRLASVDDVSHLEWLEGHARDALRGVRGGPRWLDEHPRRGARWRDAIEHDIVLVGDLDGVCLGYMVGRVVGRLGIVDEPYVIPAARENGYGDAMLAEMIGRFRAAGARTLDGEALPGDRDTKNLYERAGIKARLITVSADL